MNFVEEMKKKAAALQNRIVFPEGTEERTIEAAGKIVAQKLAKEVILLGNADEIKKAVEELFVAANYNLPRDVYERICACAASESSAVGMDFLRQANAVDAGGCVWMTALCCGIRLYISRCARYSDDGLRRPVGLPSISVFTIISAVSSPSIAPVGVISMQSPQRALMFPAVAYTSPRS